MYVWFYFVIRSVFFSAQDTNLWFLRTELVGTEIYRCHLAISTELLLSDMGSVCYQFPDSE